VGKILPFRRRRRWTRQSDHAGPRFWPDEDKVTLRASRARHAAGMAARFRVRDTIGWLVVLRPFILLGILVSVSMAPVADPALVDTPAFLSTDPESVSATFTRCGPGRGHACVIDGDTFKLGHARCGSSA
jgi:micrococcal nuclease